MNPRKSPFFVQFAPTRDTWFDVLRLLVEHGASVHEFVAGRSLAMLDIVESRTRARTSSSFASCRVNHPQISQPQASTMRRLAVECLEFLKNSSGIGFTRLAADDSRSVLHYGAEFATDTSVLKFLLMAGTLIKPKRHHCGDSNVSN
jgi:hypothetical protein